MTGFCSQTRLAARLRSGQKPPGMDLPRCFERPLAPACFFFLPLLLDGLIVFQTYAIDVEVKDEFNISCLFAKWMLTFSVTYEGADVYKTSTFMLPEDVSYEGSSCGNQTNGPVLSIEFGKGNSWAIHFTKTQDTYQGFITFTYDTGDAVFFPDAKRKEQVTVFADYPASPIKLNTAFSCSTENIVKSGNVTQNFQNVTLQAFLQDGKLSSQQTLCDINAMMSAAAGKSVVVPAGNARATLFNDTGASSPTSPILPSEGKPGTGSYTLKSDETACLLANLGLQVNVTQQVPLIINFNPNTTLASGYCGETTAVLRLSDGNHKVDFLFALRNTTLEKFYLKGLDIVVGESINATNHSLSDWETTLGNSYLCRREESIVVVPGYTVNVFDLKIQPFEVESGQFSAAQECLLDDDNVLIPIIVGSALAGLIVVIVTTYLIGRRKTYAGYQSL